MTENGDANLQDALKAAASAAAVGAAVGAARAYTARRHEPPDDASEREPADEPDDEPEDEPEAEHEQLEPREQPPDEPEDAEPVSAGDAGGIVAQARRLLRDLHGSDAESVSSIARGRRGWAVGLEVVELRRIPDSTDVLATYEVELDDDGRLVRLERVRRYHRSEADRGGRS